MSPPVLYVIACAASPASEVGTLITCAQRAGWATCLLVTPSAVRFLDATALAELTGYPVRSEYKHPADPDVLPEPDAIIVAPATVNTINKWAAGICDTLALGILVEAIGKRLPIVAVPWSNAAHAAHPVFAENIGRLRSWGVQVLQGPAAYPAPGVGDEQLADFPWQQALAALEQLRRSRPGAATMAAMPADRHRPAELEITSPANPRIKQLVALRRRRERDQAAVTLVEGLAEIELAIAAGVRPLMLFYCPQLASQAGMQPAADAAEAGAEVIRVSRQVFDKISYREGPDGWLAVVPSVRASLDRLELGPDPLVLVCAGLEKPGNLGAILRTADAAGVAAVIAADQVTDWGNPNVVRASKGTVFCVPVASGTSDEVLDWIAGHDGMRIAAATPDAGQPVTEADLTGPTAIAVGAEQSGLSAQWLERADIRVRIPMFGRADSLNVSTSAAIITYEAVRQRMLSADLKSSRPVR